MKNLDPTTASPAGQGFQISNQPVLPFKRRPGSEDGVNLDSPAIPEADVLYVVARDPRTLFVYWDLDWTRLFAGAGISARQVHLRIYRADGSVEGTREINPFLGHSYISVDSAGRDYCCELGCFCEDEWMTLLRSGKAVTPEDRMSEDLSAQFATLPIHLSFQRVLDILRAPKDEGATLARSVAELQEKACGANGLEAQSFRSSNEALSSDVFALLQAARTATPTAEDLAKWRQFGEQFGGSSWGGASGSGFGGSSPA